MSMECSSVATLMHKYLDKETTAEEEKALRIHLKTCERCFHHFHDLERTETIVQGLSRMQAPDGFVESVMSALPKEKKTIQFSRWLKNHPIFSAAAIFIILMLGSVISTWNNDGELSVSKQENLIIKDNLVIVPEGHVVEGDIVIKNGDIQIEGEVQGNVTIINGKQYMAQAGNVTGELQEINQMFEWIWYHLKQTLAKVFTWENEEASYDGSS